MADDLTLKIDADFKDAIQAFTDLQGAAVSSLKAIETQLKKTSGFEVLGNQLEVLAKTSDKSFAKIVEGAQSLKEIEKNTSFAGQAMAFFAAQIGAITAQKVFDTIKDSAKKLFDVLVVEGVHAAIEAENSINALNQALAQNGHFSEETAHSLEEYASGLQKTTKFSDDAILASLALLETMTGLNEEGLKEAEAAALNLSAAYKIDLDSATRLIGKASEGSYESLRKLGIGFEKGKTDAETFSNILEGLNSKLGGRAAAEVNTYSGAIAVASHAFEDIQKTIGFTVVQNVALVDVIKSVAEIFNGTNEETKNLSKTIREVLAASISVAVDAFGVLFSAIDVVAKSVNGFVSLFSETGGTISAIGFAMRQALSGDISGAFSTLKKNGEESNAAIKSAFSDTTVFGTFAQEIAKVGNVAEDGLAKVVSGVVATVEPTNQAKKATKEMSDEYVKLGESGAKLIQSLAEKADPSLVLNNQLKSIEAAVNTHNATMAQAEAAREQLRVENEAKNAAVLTEKNNKEISDLETRNAALAEIDAEANAAEIANNQNHINYLIGQQGSYSTAVLVNDAKLAKQKKDLQKKSDDEYVKNREAFLSTASTLARSENQSLAAIGKAAAVTQIAIKTPPAVASSFEFGTKLGGPPLGFVFAGIAATAMAAQAAQIAGIPLATGSDFVRGPGTSTSDSIPARLSVGERVVPAKTNQDLTEFLSGNTQTNGLLSSILNRLQSLESTIVVNVGNREIVREVRQGLLEGRVLAV